QIMKFGLVNRTQYSTAQKEILDLITIVSDEDPENINYIEDFPSSREHLEKYYPQVLSAQVFPELKYTYGQRIFDFKGVNQVAYIIDSLKEAGHTRRAVLCLWDPLRDEWNADKKEWVKENQPCLDLIQCRIQDNRLMMTVYIRSNDMFKAWPENAFALRQLQQMIRQGVGGATKLGDLIIISHSAHIYEQDWAKAQAILKKLGPQYLETSDFIIDPRGNFYITLENQKILVRHYTPQGSLIQEFRSSDAVELKKKIGPFVSRIDHAFYLGSELEKAARALKQSEPYNQDKVKL
ncbi:MAG: thymidylate synthase, partial [bacterium]